MNEKEEDDEEKRREMAWMHQRDCSATRWSIGFGVDGCGSAA
jgi:hypothetical protein